MGAPLNRPPEATRLDEVNHNLLMLRERLDEAEAVPGESRSNLINMLRLDEPNIVAERQNPFSSMNRSLLT